MKVAHAFINAFESARVQDKALFRHFGFSTSIFWAELWGHLAWMLLTGSPPLGCQAPVWQWRQSRQRVEAAFCSVVMSISDLEIAPTVWAENLATSNALQQVPQLYRRSPYRLFSNGRYSERPYKQRFPKLPSVYTPRFQAQA